MEENLAGFAQMRNLKSYLSRAGKVQNNAKIYEKPCLLRLKYIVCTI